MFAGTVDSLGAVPESLTVTAGDGSITFTGNIGTNHTLGPSRSPAAR